MAQARSASTNAKSRKACLADVEKEQEKRSSVMVKQKKQFVCVCVNFCWHVQVLIGTLGHSLAKSEDSREQQQHKHLVLAHWSNWLKQVNKRKASRSNRQLSKYLDCVCVILAVVINWNFNLNRKCTQSALSASSPPLLCCLVLRICMLICWCYFTLQTSLFFSSDSLNRSINSEKEAGKVFWCYNYWNRVEHQYSSVCSC